jgi:hypothetical protein
MARPQPNHDELNDVVIVQRLLELGGESRANFLRIIAVGVFYLIEVINFYGLRLPGFELPKVTEISAIFHQAVTGIAVAWGFLCFGIWFCFQKRVFSSAAKYVTTTLDLILITFVLLLADGPRSPLCVVYLLIVILAALRFSLPLLWFSTGAAILGYLTIVSNAKWYRPEYVVPHYYILIFAVALILAGIVLGQILRKIRKHLRDGGAQGQTIEGVTRDWT